MMRKILLIRHGATALNSDDHSVDRIRGWQDWELSAQGLDEAHKLAERMYDQPPDILLCSDLKRAVQTARIIIGFLGCRASRPNRAFRPWNVGYFVGEKAAEVVPVLARYAAETPDLVVPGGESFNDFRDRFLTGLQRALDVYQGTIGIVTHHRCERLLKAWLKGGVHGFDKEEFAKKGKTTGTVQIIAIPSLRRWQGGELAGVGAK